MLAEMEKRIQAKQKIPTYIYQHVWRSMIPTSFDYENTVFVCIGTNRCTGDAFGPLVGTHLKNRGYTNIYGTIEDPVHHQNLEDTVKQVSPHKRIIAIDAAMGRLGNVGYLFLEKGPVHPGSGVGKTIPPVGDYHIKGIVNINAGAQNSLLLMSTPLDRVMEMARQTSFLLGVLFPRKKIKQEPPCSERMG